MQLSNRVGAAARRSPRQRCCSGAWTLAMVLAMTGCAIDRSIVVESGEQRGAVRVIDGDLEVRPGGTVASVRVIDGDVRLHPGSRVDGSVHVTDGTLTMLDDALVKGDVVAHHASLDLGAASVEGDVDAFCVGGGEGVREGAR